MVGYSEIEPFGCDWRYIAISLTTLAFAVPQPIQIGKTVKNAAFLSGAKAQNSFWTDFIASPPRRTAPPHESTPATATSALAGDPGMRGLPP
jgi:hypothetical protein